jgi:hypothetical protein
VAATAAAAPSRWSSSTTTSLTCACSLKTSPAGAGRPPPAPGCCSRPTSRGCPSRSHAPCPPPPIATLCRRRPAGRPVGAHRPAGAAGHRHARG